MEEKDLFENMASMQRLKYDAKLISDCTRVCAGIAKNTRVLSKRFKKKAYRRIEQNFILGLKQIANKIPVFIELPKLESCGNGMYKEVDPKTNEPINNEIHVTPIEPTQQAIEQRPSKVIEYNN